LFRAKALARALFRITPEQRNRFRARLAQNKFCYSIR